MKKKFSAVMVLALALAMSATSAFATSVVDYSALVTSVTGEISPTVTAILPLAGTLLAISVGWKLVKRFTKG